MLKNRIKQEDFDKLPAVLQAEYSKSGDDFILQAEEAVTLQGSLQKEREARTEKERELARLAEQMAPLKAIDLERYKKLVEAEESAAEKKALEEKDFEAAKRLAVEAAIKPLNEKLLKLESDLKDETAFTAQATVGEKLSTWIGTHVAPQHQKAFRALLEQDYKPTVLRDGKDRKPVFIENGLQVAFDDFVSKLPEQDWAKHYLLSDNNGSGGGAEPGKVVNGTQNNGAGGKKTIKSSDTAGIQANFDAIAKGEVVVVD